MFETSYLQLEECLKPLPATRRFENPLPATRRMFENPLPATRNVPFM
jgi:hypothetical protein